MSTMLGYPYTSVVLIQFTQLTSTGIVYGHASGVLIAPDEVLTASHVITDTVTNPLTGLATAANQSSKNFVITPAFNNGSSPYVSAGAVNTHYNYIYDPKGTITNSESQIDYAVIHLDHAYTNIGLMSLVADSPGGMAAVAGYPGSSPTQANIQGTYTKLPDFSLYTGPDTGAGSSGGPVIVDYGFGPQVAGLVSSGNGTAGFFPIITSTVLAQIQTWVAQDDGVAVASRLTLPSGAGFAFDLAAYEKRALIGSQPAIVLSNQTPAVLSLQVGDITTGRDALSLLVAPFSIDLGTASAMGTAATVKGTTVGVSSQVTSVQFADGRLVYDPTDPAAQVSRLYGAAFGRIADQQGLVAWTSSIQGGSSVTQVAGAFVASGEFQARYGTLSDNAFVTQLYKNVLNRAPDAAGLAAWDSRLASGMTRGGVLAGFSDSAEYVTDTTPLDKAGLFVLDAAAPEVARLYETVLGRLPDAAGMRFFDDAIDHAGISLTSVANSMLSSDEYQRDFGKLSTADFITSLYATTLHRAPDAAGAAAWNSALNSGALTRSQVAVGFSESVEHTILSASNVYGATPASYGVKLLS